MESSIKVQVTQEDDIGTEFSKHQVTNPFSLTECTVLRCVVCKGATRMHCVQVDGKEGKYSYHCPGSCHDRFLKDEKERQCPILLALVRKLQDKGNEDRKRMEEEQKKMDEDRKKIEEDRKRIDEDRKMFTETVANLVKQNPELETVLQSLKTVAPNTKTGTELSGTEEGLDEKSEWNFIY